MQINQGSIQILTEHCPGVEEFRNELEYTLEHVHSEILVKITAKQDVKIIIEIMSLPFNPLNLDYVRFNRIYLESTNSMFEMFTFDGNLQFTLLNDTITFQDHAKLSLFKPGRPKREIKYELTLNQDFYNKCEEELINQIDEERKEYKDLTPSQRTAKIKSEITEKVEDETIIQDIQFTTRTKRYTGGYCIYITITDALGPLNKQFWRSYIKHSDGCAEGECDRLNKEANYIIKQLKSIIIKYMSYTGSFNISFSDKLEKKNIEQIRNEMEEEEKRKIEMQKSDPLPEIDTELLIKTLEHRGIKIGK